MYSAGVDLYLHLQGSPSDSSAGSWPGKAKAVHHPADCAGLADAFGGAIF